MAPESISSLMLYAIDTQTPLDDLISQAYTQDPDTEEMIEALYQSKRQWLKHLKRKLWIAKSECKLVDGCIYFRVWGSQPRMNAKGFDYYLQEVITWREEISTWWRERRKGWEARINLGKPSPLDNSKALVLIWRDPLGSNPWQVAGQVSGTNRDSTSPFQITFILNVYKIV